MPFVCMEGLRNGGTATCESSQVHIYRLGSECSGRPGSGRSGGWAGRQLMKKQEWSHILLPAKGAAAQGASVPWLPAAGCSQGTSVPLGSSGRCGSGYWSGAEAAKGPVASSGCCWGDGQCGCGPGRLPVSGRLRHSQFVSSCGLRSWGRKAQAWGPSW